MRRSHGPRQGTRNSLKKRSRDRGKLTITRQLKEFKVGDTVLISPEPAVQKGMPHRRFFNKHAKVVDKRGKAYVLEVKDQKAMKKIISLPVHLRLSK
jgi:large subunit ribosomal protein L21e